MRGAMGDMQHFCLRWNNYQSSITSAFENLRDDEDFVDVTLACDGKSLKAHRVVLSACSPYFRELLKSTPCKHPVIVLQDVMYEDLHALVEFIYHGEVNVRQRSLSSFLKTAEVLRVSGLTQQSEAVSMGLDRRNFTDERGSPQNRKQQHKHRDRPSLVQENVEHQDNSLPAKRVKSEGQNNHRSETPQLGSDDLETPPVDFSTNSGGGGSNKETLLHSPGSGSQHGGGGSGGGNGGGGGGLPPGLGDIKPEPIELTPHLHNDKDDSQDSGGLGGGGDVLGESGSLQQVSTDHDDSLQSSHNYLDSKLFAGAPGFNFMAAALAADSLAGSHFTAFRRDLSQPREPFESLNNQPHGLGGSDGLAGTSSQGFWHRERPGRPVNSQRPDEPSFVCDTCHKRYRTISSLRNHKSVYHRQNRHPPSSSSSANNNDKKRQPTYSMALPPPH